MNTKHSSSERELLGLPDPISQQAHYQTPDGYLDNLTDEIMARLPETSRASIPVGRWTCIKPIVYLVACFVGLALTFQGIRTFVEPAVRDGAQPSEMVAHQSSNVDDELWAQYYEDYSASLIEQDYILDLAEESSSY